MGKTNIEWADKSLNFYTWNCSKVSPGCKFCYAAAQSQRFGGKNSAGGDFLKFAPKWRESSMKDYRKLEAGDVVFVNSMSDTFHEDVPFEYVKRIYDLAGQKPDTIFLLLTKRPGRALELAPQLPLLENVWLGTSVESADYLHRLDSLLQIPAAGHFLSAEPLIGALDGLEDYLYPTKERASLDWVIVGGESGKYRRDFNDEWAIDIQTWCATAGVPFMFKQGSAFKPGQDRLLMGRTWDESPFAKKEEPEEAVEEVPYQMSFRW